MFGNPNDMALHLVSMVPLALALLLASRGALRKAVFAACALLFAVAVVVTYSRGGFLGLACALFVMAWKLGRRHRLAVCLCVLAGVALLFALAPGNYAERVGSIIGFGEDRVGSASARKELFWRSLFVAARHPVFGVGLGNFHIVSIKEQVSHNAYTQVASEMGVPAMIVYVLFMIVPLRSLRRIERETYEARRAARTYYVAVGMQAALVGYMVSSFFASVAYQWYVYYLVGYAVALRRLHESGEEWAANYKPVPVATPADDAAGSGDEDARVGAAADFRGAAGLPSI
jgi:O-antigen ligase